MMHHYLFLGVVGALLEIFEYFWDLLFSSLLTAVFLGLRLEGSLLDAMSRKRFSLLISVSADTSTVRSFFLVI
jgi:hypothetical protein